MRTITIANWFPLNFSGIDRVGVGLIKLRCGHRSRFNLDKFINFMFEIYTNFRELHSMACLDSLVSYFKFPGQWAIQEKDENSLISIL
jgi:hypothetical protein